MTRGDRCWTTVSILPTDEDGTSSLFAELKLIHKALFDPYDQSLWFYHQNLMCTLDPELAARTMAPNLNDTERLEYLVVERGFVEEILEDTTDCKWVYQALIELALLEAKLDGAMSQQSKTNVLEWLEELKSLDPLRLGRWRDLENSLTA